MRILHYGFDLKSSRAYLALEKRLKHIEKNGSLSVGIKPVDETIAEVTPLCKKIGVTRISDITYMDKLYIPNYSVVLPGTDDSIWVYSGKGATKSQAKASALMESIERYSSLRSTYSKNLIRGSYLQLSNSYDKVLHPDEVVEPVLETFEPGTSIMDFATGFDLTNREEVLVPVQLVFSRYQPVRPATSVFSFSHTNGLASGNVLEEAICHALCEVIERDAVSIADLCASCIPYTILDRISTTLRNTQDGKFTLTPVPEDKFVDDSSIFPDVDISEIAMEFEPIRLLVKRFTDTGIPLLIKEITQKDIRIPTFLASSVEWVSSDYGYFAKGYGTHPDARIALIRAITELSQTRANNIQGARDDLKRITYKENDEIYKRKWQFIPASSSSALGTNNNTIKFSEIKSHVNRSVLDDIKLILNRLSKAGLSRVIIVDLTNRDVNVPVVRAIVPGLETFEVAKLFGNQLFMGSRAKNHFQRMR